VFRRTPADAWATRAYAGYVCDGQGCGRMEQNRPAAAVAEMRGFSNSGRLIVLHLHYGIRRFTAHMHNTDYRDRDNNAYVFFIIY